MNHQCPCCSQMFNDISMLVNHLNGIHPDAVKMLVSEALKPSEASFPQMNLNVQTALSELPTIKWTLERIEVLLKELVNHKVMIVSDSMAGDLAAFRQGVPNPDLDEEPPF